MAAAKKKTATKKKTKQSSKKFNNQFWSVIIFSVGVLVAMLTFVQGSALWKTIHNGFLGMFGVSVFLVAPIMIYAAIMMALDKSPNAVTAKIIQGFILILLFSAIVQVIFVGKVDGTAFLNKLKNLYNNGTNLKGGGLFSAVLGWPLLALFNRVGASIIIVILTFTFIMLLTNISLISMFKFLVAPFTKSYKVIKTASEEKAANQEDKKNLKVDIAKYLDSDKPDKVKADTSPIENEQDILPIHPVKAPKITKEKLKETAKKTDNPELQQIIQKAVSTDTPVSDKNNIYVENDGQTCLYQKDNSINMYKCPPFSLLNPQVASNVNSNTQSELKQNSEVLINTLKSFGVQTRIVDINRGPSVTRYELQPAAGVKVSRITNLTDDIKMSLAAKSIRIEAPIPGKAAVGIEVPNNEVDIITMREMLETKEFTEAKSNIAFALGKDITGEVIFADIAKMPHVLIAGATGSGKSVCINSLIISLLYKSSPDDVRLLMIDPKMVELEVYNGIPHLLIPVVTDSRKAAGALSWAVTEMQKRYKLFSDYNVRNLTGFNEMAKNTEGIDPLPQIVIIIDELADLMMVAAKEVEEAICRIAQLARAAGMHLVIATQRPSVDIITGVIKANIPTRIAFAVSSQVDSRTILDGAGAEKLLGRGDMLYSAYGAPKPTRIQGCFVSDKEVESVVAFIKNEIKPEYDETIIQEIEKNAPVQKGEATGGGSIDSSDEMIEKAIEVIVDAGQASTSYLQRRLKLGYARAARIMDELEQMGIIGPPDGAKPRAVLMTKEQWYESQMSKE